MKDRRYHNCNYFSFFELIIVTIKEGQNSDMVEYDIMFQAFSPA